MRRFQRRCIEIHEEKNGIFRTVVGMLLKRGMGNGKWEMGNGKLKMGNEKLKMGN